MMFVDVGMDILFNLFIKVCMFIASTTENSKGCLDLIVIGHIYGFEKA
jgi:hypothetical protein